MEIVGLGTGQKHGIQPVSTVRRYSSAIISLKENVELLHLTEEEIQKLFLQAVNKVVKNKKEIISTHKEMAKIIFDTSEFEKEKIELEEELNIVAKQVNDCINKNARKVQNQDEYEIRYTSLVNRFNTTRL